jgi:hypothetical protein
MASKSPKKKPFDVDFHHILKLDHQQYFLCKLFRGIEVVKMAAS